jgi:hypothetical protein
MEITMVRQNWNKTKPRKYFRECRGRHFSAGKPGRIGANRILDMPGGEQLPRIC